MIRRTYINPSWWNRRLYKDHFWRMERIAERENIRFCGRCGRPYEGRYLSCGCDDPDPEPIDQDHDPDPEPRDLDDIPEW